MGEERDARGALKGKKRIVIKIGSSSLTHEETGDLNLGKIEKLVRMICDLRGTGREVVLVSSGAIAAGRQALGCEKPQTVARKQAFAAVGQARLMMVYQKLFAAFGTHAKGMAGFCQHGQLSVYGGAYRAAAWNHGKAVS